MRSGHVEHVKHPRTTETVCRPTQSEQLRVSLFWRLNDSIQLPKKHIRNIPCYYIDNQREHSLVSPGTRWNCEQSCLFKFTCLKYMTTPWKKWTSRGPQVQDSLNLFSWPGTAKQHIGLCSDWGVGGFSVTNECIRGRVISTSGRIQTDIRLDFSYFYKVHFFWPNLFFSIKRSGLCISTLGSYRVVVVWS